jgi:hypothetical protein
MAVYQVTDPVSGIKLRLTGDSPPTEAELEGMFANEISRRDTQAAQSQAAQVQAQPQAQPQAQMQAQTQPQPQEQPQQVVNQPPAATNSRFSNSGPSFNNAMQPEQAPLDDSDNRETRATRELPEFVRSGILNGESLADITKISTAAAVTMDPRELGAIITNLLPHIGITEDEKGNILASNNKNGVQSVINPPGFSAIDLAQTGAAVAAFSPAASVASIPAKLGVKAAVGATGSGLTQTAIESLQSQLGGEFSESEIAIATSLGGVAELVIPAIQALRQSRQAGRINVSNNELADAAPSINEGREAVEAVEALTGQNVGLFPAQQTRTPSQLNQQRVLPQLDAGSATALKKLNKQNDEAFFATVKLLDTIAPSSVTFGAPARIRTAANNAIDATKLARKEASQFGQVIAAADEAGAGANVNLSQLKANIDDLLDESVSSGELESTITKISKFLTPREGKQFLTFRQLQRVKKEMDAIINASPVSEKAIDPSVKGEVVKLKTKLLTAMKDAYPPFDEASKVFIRESGSVEAIQASLVQRIAKASDSQLKNISSEIFNARTNVGDIAIARKAIEDVDPVAWRDIVRNELDFRINSIGKEILDSGTDSVANMPGLLKRKLFGVANQREVLLRSMNDAQRSNFKYLEQVLSRAEIGRAAGSPTASFTEIIQNMRGKLGVLKDVLLRPIATAQNTGDASLFDMNVRGITEAMFDTKWLPRVREIRSLNQNSPAAARAMAQLVDDVNSEQKEDK